MIEQSGYGKATSTARSWIGIVAGAVGTITGIGFILFMVFGKRCRGGERAPRGLRIVR